MEPPTDPGRRYWAFISYSSHDAEVARWLHRRLEGYRIPRSLVGRPGRDGPVPARVFPVFRDRDELPLSSNLGTTIGDALRASRFLVVLCSPHAAQSRWVNEEIRQFKAHAGEERILALIVDGVPNATDHGVDAERECFPRALRHRVGPDGELVDDRCEPIAGDLRAAGDGRERAFLKAIAGITGLGFDVFVDRERIRRRRRLSAIAALVIACTLAGLFAFDRARLKVAHFEDVEWRFSVPVGTVPISGSKAARRAGSWTLESRGGLVLKATQSRGAAEVAGPPASAMIFEYDTEGHVARESLQSTGGTTVQEVTTSWSTDGNGRAVQQVQFREPNTRRSASGSRLFAGEIGELLGGGSQVMSELRTFDEQGRLLERVFLDLFGKPLPDPRGVYGVRHEYADGWLIAKVHLGKDGSPAPDLLGVVETRFRQDGHGRVLEISTHGRSGEPIEVEGRSARQTYEYEGEQLTSKRFWTASGEPGFNEQGIHEVRFTADDVAYFAMDGSPCDNLVTGIHRVETERDEQGRLVEYRSFGVDGSPRFATGLLAVRESTSYPDASTFETRFYLADGSPGSSAGYARRTVRTLDDGVVETRWYGPEGEPTLEPSLSAHAQVSRRDASGFEVDIRLFDQEGQACEDPKGVHRWSMERDSRGNLVARAMFDRNGQPTAAVASVHREVRTLDDWGNVSRLARFGTSGEPVAFEGVHEWRIEYHRNGFLRAGSAFGTHGEPVELEQIGLHRVETDQSDFFDVGVIRYFGADGRLRPPDYGPAIIESEWIETESGLSIRTSFRGPDGQPVPMGDSLFDATNRVTLGKDGFAIDASGTGQSATTEDSAGVPTGRTLGQAWRTLVSVGPTNQTEEIYTFIDGIACRVHHYGQGLVPDTEYKWFSPTGELVEVDGICRKVLSYDSRGRLSRDAEYRLDGRSRVWTDVSDGMGVVEVRTFAADGNPSAELAEYDPDRNLDLQAMHAERLRYGPDGQLAALTTIDLAGNEIRVVFGDDGTETRSFHHADGSPREVDGTHRLTIGGDQDGGNSTTTAAAADGRIFKFSVQSDQVFRAEAFESDGVSPGDLRDDLVADLPFPDLITLPDEPVKTVVRRKDPGEEKIMEVLTFVDGSMALLQRGGTILTPTRTLEMTLLDAAGNAAQPFGWHRAEYRYEENGDHTCRYFRIDGSPTVVFGDVHTIRVSTTVDGRLVRYYRIDGMPATDAEGLHLFIYRPDGSLSSSQGPP